MHENTKTNRQARRKHSHADNENTLHWLSFQYVFWASPVDLVLQPGRQSAGRLGQASSERDRPTCRTPTEILSGCRASHERTPQGFANWRLRLKGILGWCVDGVWPHALFTEFWSCARLWVPENTVLGQGTTDPHPHKTFPTTPLLHLPWGHRQGVCVCVYALVYLVYLCIRGGGIFFIWICIS